MSDNLIRLKQLSNSPKEQSLYALELIEDKKNTQIIKAALDVLANNPIPEARLPLLDLYKHYNSKRDMGGYVRSDILKALRHICQRDDIPLIERAILNYEFSSTKHEEASILRSNALIVLNELDSKLAGYYCIKLLTDKHTSTMSGEPALTAIRIFVSEENFLPLYYCAVQSKSGSSEVISECLKNLSILPLPLAHELVESYQEVEDDIILLGLFDMVLNHNGYLDFKRFIVNFLKTTEKYEVYRYVVVAILTSRKKDLIEEILPTMDNEDIPKKLDILQEALPLISDHPGSVSILNKIKKKLERGTTKDR